MQKRKLNRFNESCFKDQNVKRIVTLDKNSEADWSAVILELVKLYSTDADPLQAYAGVVLVKPFLSLHFMPVHTLSPLLKSSPNVLPKQF